MVQPGVTPSVENPYTPCTASTTALKNYYNANTTVLVHGQHTHAQLAPTSCTVQASSRWAKKWAASGPLGHHRCCDASMMSTVSVCDRAAAEAPQVGHIRPIRLWHTGCLQPKASGCV
jgi:hypothetical protein